MKKKIYITSITIMTFVLSSCGKVNDIAFKEEITVPSAVETTEAISTTNSVIDDTWDDDMCDGYFAPTIVDDAFLEAYSLVEGVWLTEDKNTMLMVSFNEDDELYYLGMYRANEEGICFMIPTYNMYSINISDRGIYQIDILENEKHISFYCNDGLMQMNDDLIVDENREYIRYIEHNIERDEDIFYPCQESEIPDVFEKIL